MFNTLIIVVAVVVVVSPLVLPAAHVDAVVGYEQSGLVLQIARQLYMDYCTDWRILIGFDIFFKLIYIYIYIYTYIYIYIFLLGIS